MLCGAAGDVDSHPRRQFIEAFPEQMAQHSPSQSSEQRKPLNVLNARDEDINASVDTSVSMGRDEEAEVADAELLFCPEPNGTQMKL